MSSSDATFIAPKYPELLLVVKQKYLPYTFCHAEANCPDSTSTGAGGSLPMRQYAGGHAGEGSSGVPAFPEEV